jgi:hypothetical protein
LLIVEPYHEHKVITDFLTGETKKVGIVFFHGVGDCMMFATSFDKLKALYPTIHFDIMLQKGLDEELIFPEAILLNNLDEIKTMEDYDYIFLVHFPVEESGKTKSELCCQTELGISATSGYKKLPKFKNKLIGVHFHNTALPGVLNCPKEIAEKIWNEILEVGYIPIDLHFKHVFHNPVNEKYDFIDCGVRRAQPKLETLLGLIQDCAGIIAVASGPFHCAMGIKPEKIMFIKNGVSKEAFTYQNIPFVDVNNYQDGKVKEWVATLS